LYVALWSSWYALELWVFTVCPSVSRLCDYFALLCAFVLLVITTLNLTVTYIHLGVFTISVTADDLVMDDEFTLFTMINDAASSKICSYQ
jgi:hypothetical protein